MMRIPSYFDLVAVFAVLPAVLSAVEVPADQVQWSVGNRFWTHNGVANVQVNRNLEGNPIRIGGKRFRTGLTGHTPFSLVYNLDGTADSFSAEVGAEDEDNVRDKPGEADDFEFQVLVDRRKVYSRRFANGQPPELLNIDLRGASQLELRGDFGRGFLRQRVALGNPVFRTGNPEKLRRTLDTAWTTANRLYHPSLVEPVTLPAWKAISIQRIPYSEFPHSLRLDNGLVEAVLTPEFGGRVLGFRRKGGRELLMQNQNYDRSQRLVRGNTGDFAGGHFMRPEPLNYFLPADPLLKHGPFDVDFPAEGVVRMRSPENPVFLFRYEYTVTMRPGRAELEIENRIVNGGKITQNVGVWSITRFENVALKTILLPPRENPIRETHRGNCSWMRQKWSEKGLEVSCFFDPAKGKKEFYEMQYRPTKPRMEVVFRDGIRMRIAFSGVAGRDSSYYPLHFMLMDAFTELESHGPLTLLKPGESVSLREVWSLAD